MGNQNIKNNKKKLERFIEPSNLDYEIALKEIKNGKKKSHWIWYIFPQLKGLGNSYNSNYYGIKDINEAKEYLNHNILGNRLIEITETLLNLNINDPIEIFGDIDSKKVNSCMTLFYYASFKKNSLFKNVINKYYNGEYCKNTIRLLNRKKTCC